MNSRNGSIDRCSSTSTASGGIYSLTSEEEVLNRLKTMLFHVYLITHLEVYPSDGIKITQMLKKVDVQVASPLILKFMVEASTFLDHLLVDLAEKKRSRKECTVELAFLNSSVAASEGLKETLDKQRADFNTRATNIS